MVTSPLIIIQGVFLAVAAEYWCAVEDFASRLAEADEVLLKKHCVAGERVTPVFCSFGVN